MTTLYAWRTANKPRPDKLAAGCPATGWIHEGRPPWRVIVFADAKQARRMRSAVVVEYTGDEATVNINELTASTERGLDRG